MKDKGVCTKAVLFFLSWFIYFKKESALEREREREREGKHTQTGQRKREGERGSQPGSVLSAQSPTQGQISLSEL